jgi:hypothetical protein
MKRFVLVALMMLAIFLAACSGPVNPDEKTDGEKLFKSFTVVYTNGGQTPLFLSGPHFLTKHIIIRSGERKSVVLKVAKPEVKLVFGAAIAGYIHPKELDASLSFLTVKAGSTITLSGQAIPWLFPQKYFNSKKSISGSLVRIDSLNELKWGDDGRLITDGNELLMQVSEADPSLILVTSRDTNIKGYFRWTGKEFSPASNNLKSVSIRHLVGSLVPDKFKEVFSFQGHRSRYAEVTGEATWEVTIEVTDKQGRPFKKSYYALVAKPY